MLWGRCSCAISERPTPSPTSKNPLSPIIPVHTQKQGGGAHFSALSPHSSSVLSVSSVVNQLSTAGDSNRLEISAANCELSTVNCALAPQKPPFTGELIENVGAPTFSYRSENTLIRVDFVDAGLQPRQLGMTEVMHLHNLSHDGSRLCTRIQLPTVDCGLLLSANSNHSRTSTSVARKSNHSRTCAKQGGGGCLRVTRSPLTPLFSLAIVTIWLSI